MNAPTQRRAEVNVAEELTDFDELATVCDALGHPIRVAIYTVLRKEKRLALAELRRAVSEAYMETDTRGVQFHLYKLQLARIVAVTRQQGREVVELVRTVSVRVGATH